MYWPVNQKVSSLMLDYVQLLLLFPLVLLLQSLQLCVIGATGDTLLSMSYVEVLGLLCNFGFVSRDMAQSSCRLLRSPVLVNFGRGDNKAVEVLYFALNMCMCGCAYDSLYQFVASQQDKENSDKKKKRQKSTISLNQLKYSYDIITCCTVINTIDHYHGHTPLIIV